MNAPAPRELEARVSESERPPIASPATFGSSLTLTSLAPGPQEGEHAVYVRHLKNAVSDPRNKNIALTGRYGSGKSSVLDLFESSVLAEEGKQTLRISISTLGPDDGEDLTNRIQKELVKQLVYRARPGQIKRSRFARTKPLTGRKASVQALGFAVLLVALLRIFGVGPVPGAFGVNNEPALLAILGVLVFLAAWAVRWALGDRFVTQFSSGGTSIQLTEKHDTYFDEYVDEIMAFFEATKPAFVVFEDLDRFENPQIFDSLRELNSLVNSSAELAESKEPIRFIYAIKDSLFEQLGFEPFPESDSLTMKAVDQADAQKPTSTPRQATAKPTGPGQVFRATDGAPDRPLTSKKDTVVAEVERANRTKFFEVVIPVVPFLTHANARDYLARAIAGLGLPRDDSISRGLQDTVARHVTDMRLLINIRNEFVVFAQRLLWVKNRAPGMTADDLFALVAYKNFHLADFERIPQRASVLDALEKVRRDIVDTAIARLLDERRNLENENSVRQRQSETAQKMGERLAAMFGRPQDPLYIVQIDGTAVEPSEIRERSFWRHLAGGGQLEARSRDSNFLALSDEQRRALFPEATDPSQWEDPNELELGRLRATKDAEIAALRGADFAFLAREKTYLAGGVSFEASVESLLPSELGRSLIRRGYIGRYYAEHTAVFHGSFVGVDVANFFRNAVFPNEMSVNAKFTSLDAVQNLLEQAPYDFTSSRSVFNIAIVNHMLMNLPEKAREVVAFIVSEPNEDALSFLKQYLNAEGSRGADLVGLLAASPWPGLFDFLALEDSAPAEEGRLKMLDAALLLALDAHEYLLGEDACRLIVEHHSEFTAVSDDGRTKEEARTVFTFLERASVFVPKLNVLGRHLKGLVVDSDRYVLDAANLRTATDLADDRGIALDNLRANDRVWCRCLDEVEIYLDVVSGDAITEYAIETAQVLGDALTYICDQVDFLGQRTEALLDLSSPAASLPDLGLAPTDTWKMIASASRMVPNVANIHAYFDQVGQDEAIASVLAAGQGAPVGLEEASTSAIHAVMIRILNSPKFIDAKQRVALAQELNAFLEPDSLSIAEIIPFPDELFAELLRAKLVPDSDASFAHFLTAGWGAVSGACEVSAGLKGFLTPQLVKGHVLELLNDSAVPFNVKRAVLNDLDSYAGRAEYEVLGLALHLARTHAVRLPFDQVQRAAAHSRFDEDVLWQLAHGGKLDSPDAPAYLATLAALGGDFLPFGEGTNAEVHVPKSDLVSLVVDRLQQAGAVRRVSGTNNHWLKVVVT